MAAALYGKGRNTFSRGESHWKATAGDTFRAMLVDSALYTKVIDTDEFFSDVPAGARKGNNGGNTRADMPQLTLLDPALGVHDANNIIFTTVPAGSALEYLVIFKDTGVDGTSPLIACIDDATGLPITPNGADINVTWDDGANKIFKL